MAACGVPDRRACVAVTGVGNGPEMVGFRGSGWLLAGA